MKKNRLKVVLMLVLFVLLFIMLSFNSISYLKLQYKVLVYDWEGALNIIDNRLNNENTTDLVINQLLIIKVQILRAQMDIAKRLTEIKSIQTVDSEIRTQIYEKYNSIYQDNHRKIQESINKLNIAKTKETQFKIWIRLSNFPGDYFAHHDITVENAELYFTEMTLMRFNEYLKELETGKGWGFLNLYLFKINHD